MPKRTTLRDIAQELQLSVSSVSLALRGHPRIPENTTEKVRQTAARLGYIYNRAAADLRRAESRLVAVCINDLSNPVFNEFLVQIEEELHSQDRAVFLGVARESAELQRQFLKTALEHGVSGIILCPVQGTGVADLDMLLPAGDGTAPVVPTAVFSRRIAAASLTQFVNDDPLTGRLAAGCVLDEGHRRIGWLGPRRRSATAPPPAPLAAAPRWICCAGRSRPRRCCASATLSPLARWRRCANWGCVRASTCRWWAAMTWTRPPSPPPA